MSEFNKNPGKAIDRAELHSFIKNMQEKKVIESNIVVSLYRGSHGG